MTSGRRSCVAPRPPTVASARSKSGPADRSPPARGHRRQRARDRARAGGGARRERACRERRPPRGPGQRDPPEIGRASSRERVEISVEAESLKKKKKSIAIK